MGAFHALGKFLNLLQHHAFQFHCRKAGQKERRGKRPRFSFFVISSPSALARPAGGWLQSGKADLPEADSRTEIVAESHQAGGNLPQLDE